MFQKESFIILNEIENFSLSLNFAYDAVRSLSKSIKQK